MPAEPLYPTEDRWLDLSELLAALRDQGVIAAAPVGKLLASRESPHYRHLHPLEFIARQQLENQTRPGRRLSMDDLLQWLARWAGQAFMHIDPVSIDVARTAPLMSQAFAERHGILAVAADAQAVTVASAEPWVVSWEADLAHTVRRPIKRVLANPNDIARFTTQFYRMAKSVSGACSTSAQPSMTRNLEQLLDLDTEQANDPDAAPTVNIVDWLFQYAFKQRASDIHIEPRRDQGCVRFRIDGVLHDVYRLPTSVTLAVVSRLKSLGRMNVAEKRKPQDGRIKTRAPEGGEIELRLATLPTVFGEKMVMRIFDPDVLLKNFDQLGFCTQDLDKWQYMTRQPNGIVLVTGPTGSGKTTTLYTTLKQLATPAVNLCTIEDPIEMVESAFNQMQVQHNIGLSFASGVRALMRQDPDIIMIGEIRDLETAEMAIQAALTGHLVLSTLHTNDAPSAISRLLELGVAHYLIKATVLGVMAQRLVRTLCSACKQPCALDQDAWLGLTKPWTAALPAAACQAKGCVECRDTGYRGRAGVYEIMPLNERIKTLIQPDLDLQTLRQQAYREGMRSLRLSGAHKIAAGLTTLEEVLRVTPGSL